MSNQIADLQSYARSLWPAGPNWVINVADTWGSPSSTVTVTVAQSTNPSAANSGAWVNSKSASATYSSTGLASGSGIPFDAASPVGAARQVAISQAIAALTATMIAAGAVLVGNGQSAVIGPV